MKNFIHVALHLSFKAPNKQNECIGHCRYTGLYIFYEIEIFLKRKYITRCIENKRNKIIWKECEFLTANFISGHVNHFKKSSLISLDEFPYYCRVRDA